MNSLATERNGWILLASLSLFLHLFVLQDRTFHQDEVIHARLTYELAFNGAYRYDPTFHGPFLYYLGAVLFLVLGDSDFVARLITAMFGVGMVWVGWRLREVLGGKAAMWTTFLIIISPMMLFYGRFFRHDIPELFFFSFALLLLIKIRLGGDSNRNWVLFGVFLGIAFTIKENAYITVFILLSTWFFYACSTGPKDFINSESQFFFSRWRGVIVSISVFVVVVITFFTSFFQFPEDWFFPKKAIQHWAEMHDTERLGGPWWYYIFRLLQYEFLIILLAFSRIVMNITFRPIEVMCFIAGVLSIIVYAYLGEKVAWLSVHQIWFFLPLAGLQLADIFNKPRINVGKLLVFAGFVLTISVTLRANFFMENVAPESNRIEALHFVQNTQALKILSKEIRHLHHKGHKPAAAITGQYADQFVWYLRDLPIAWEYKHDSTPPIVIHTKPNPAQIELDKSRGYTEERKILIANWHPELGVPTFKSAINYFVFRKPWNDISSHSMVVMRHESLTAPD